jgi:choline transporter-like protein 2/4/5
VQVVLTDAAVAVPTPSQMPSCFSCCGAKIDPDPRETAMTPYAKRGCKDLLFLLLFIAFWIGNIVVAVVGFQNGDPSRLVYATDHNGDTCGTGALEAKKYIYYPRMNEDIVAAQAAGTDLTDIDFYGICQSSCPMPSALGGFNAPTAASATETGAKAKWVCDYTEQIVMEGLATRAAQRAYAKTKEGTKCWYAPLDSAAYFYRCFPKPAEAKNSSKVCIDDFDEEITINHSAYSEMYTNGVPNSNCNTVRSTTITVTDGMAQPNPLMDQMQTTAAKIGRWGKDLQVSAPLIAALGGGLALALGFVWLILLKYCARVITWVTLIAVVVGMGAISLYASFKGGMLSAAELAGATGASDFVDDAQTAQLAADDANQTNFKILAYISIVLTIILLFIVLFFRTKLNKAIKMLEEASNCLKDITTLITFPLVTFTGMLLAVLWFTLVSAYIASSGEITASTITATASSMSGNATLPASSLSASDTMRAMLAYHFFVWLWTNQLVQAIGMCSISGAVCQWYFESKRVFEPEVPKNPVLKSIHAALRFHIGSLCFGSLIIAVVQFIRACLVYIDQNTKNLQKSNFLLKVMMKVVQCCMWCLEKCIKFIARNAYIMVALKGKGFCKSAKDSFFLLLNNLGQLGATILISGIVLTLCKVSITAGCGFLGFVAFSNMADVTTPALPVVCTIILAWFVSSAFMGVYELTIDTLLMCYCEDKNAPKSLITSSIESKTAPKIVHVSSEVEAAPAAPVEAAPATPEKS